MKWLVTAFEPFAGAKSNSSLIVVRALKSKFQNPNLIFHEPVPVTFEGAWPNVQTSIEKHPDVDGVLALGQSNRTKISLETVAKNLADARIPDNDGKRPQNRKILPKGRDLKSQISWDTFQVKKYPESVERSTSAGAFVCNFLMYKLIEWAEAHRKLAGFVHIPVLDSQNDESLRDVAKMSGQVAIATAEEILAFLVAR